MSPWVIAGLLYLLSRSKKGPGKPPATRQSSPPQSGPPPIDQHLRRELEQVGASPTLANGIARWAALSPRDSSGQPTLSGARIVPKEGGPATLAGALLSTFRELYAMAVGMQPVSDTQKALGTTDEDMLWWAYAYHEAPEFAPASPGGSARASARGLAGMNLPDDKKTLLRNANWIAFGNGVA